MVAYVSRKVDDGRRCLWIIWKSRPLHHNIDYKRFTHVDRRHVLDISLRDVQAIDCQHLNL